MSFPKPMLDTDLERLQSLLARLRAHNTQSASVQDRRNVSSAFSDFVWGKYDDEFYTNMVHCCNRLIPQPDYPSLKPEIESFTAACNLTLKNRTFRTAEGVDDVLITWTQLQSKLQNYELLLKKDRSHYAHEQLESTDSVLYYMAKFVSNYKDKKNVWAPRVKRST